MCDPSETPSSSADSVLGWPASERSNQPQSSAHRLRTHATQSRQGQGGQGPLRTALAATTASAPRVLEKQQTNRLSVPRQDAGCSTSRNHDSDLLQVGGSQSSHQQACNAPYVEAFFRDGTTRSRGRFDGDQQAPWAVSDSAEHLQWVVERTNARVATRSVTFITLVQIGTVRNALAHDGPIGLPRPKSFFDPK